MGCFEAYVHAWKKAFVFHGRARRKEYWCFGILTVVVMLVLLLVNYSLLDASLVDSANTLNESLGVGLLAAVYAIANIAPSLSISIRRLHDMNWSGLWYLGAFVPILNIILALALMFADGTPGDNRFGPDPKGRQAVYGGGHAN